MACKYCRRFLSDFTYSLHRIDFIRFWLINYQLKQFENTRGEQAFVSKKLLCEICHKNRMLPRSRSNCKIYGCKIYSLFDCDSWYWSIWQEYMGSKSLTSSKVIFLLKIDKSMWHVYLITEPLSQTPDLTHKLLPREHKNNTWAQIFEHFCS